MKIRAIWILGSLVLFVPLILALDSSFSKLAFGEEGEVKTVINVEELYKEVNDPVNAGATIRLAPGIYQLSAKDSNGVNRPNGGKLRLPIGTSLEGHNEYVDFDGDRIWDPRDDNGDGFPDLDAAGREIFADPTTASIIDATGLMLPLNTGGFIEVFSAPNSTAFQSIKNLTLLGNHTPRAGIILQAANNGVLNANVQNCTIGSLSRGVQVDARRSNNDHNSMLDVTFKGNVFFYNNLPESSFGWGIQSSVARIDKPTTHMRLRDNRFFANKINLQIESFGVKNGVQIIKSENNIYEAAQLVPHGEQVSSGIIIAAVGLTAPSGAVDKSSDNLIKFISKEDKIWNNEGATFNEDGLFAGGGLYLSFVRLADGAESEFHNNEIEIELEDTTFVKFDELGAFDGDQNRAINVSEPTAMRRRDISIVGLTEVAKASPELTSGNKITIEVKGAASSLMPTPYDQAPEPFQIVDNASGRVDITVKGSPEEFLQENTGLNLPDESLFDLKEKNRGRK